MENRYKEIFSYDLLRKMLLLSRYISDDATKESVYEMFDTWLSKNKDFRTKVSILSEEQLKEYNISIAKEISDMKDGEFFNLNLIRMYLIKFNKHNEPKPELSKTPIADHFDNVDLRLSLSPLSFQNILSIKDNKKYYVQKMFANGTINMIFSPPANMKTFISYYLAICMATGNKFLKRKTKKVNVAYFDWENPLSDIKMRLNAICEGMGLDKTKIDNLHFFPRQPRLLEVGNYESHVPIKLKEELFDFVRDNNIKVLFFDTLRRIGSFDENDSKAINSLKSELFDPLIKEFNLCIIFLHHTSKEGKNYRGSVDIEGILDTAFSITKNESEKQTRLVIKNTKRRGNEIGKLKCIIESENHEQEDEDGDMNDITDSIIFEKIEDTEKDYNDKYSRYKDFFIEKLKLNIQYKNKELCAIIKKHNDIKSVNTQNAIIAEQVKYNVLKSYGEHKNKYYMLNPKNIDKQKKESINDAEEYLIELFEDNDLVKIDLIKQQIKDDIYCLLINQWNKNGWINKSKKDYIGVTELYRGEKK